MSALSFEKAFGQSLRLEGKPGASLQKAVVDGATLRKLYEHWLSLPAGSRPALRSLARGAGGSSVNLVLDLGDKGPWICIEAKASPLPDFSAIWPYCRWWQEELGLFGGLAFEAAEKNTGVTWRLA